MRKELWKLVCIGTLSCGSIFLEASSANSSCEGEPLDLDCQNYPAAYNAPAAIQINPTWTGFVDASFIYWYASESGLSLAESALLNSSGVVTMPFKSSQLTLTGKYHPGFKVGA